MSDIKTIRIKSPVSDDNPNGYVVINEEDKTDEQELFDAAPSVAPAAPATAWQK